jgi:integrase
VPSNENETVENASGRPALRVVGKPPRRRTYREVRVREYLTSEELQRLIKAARKHGRNSERDALMIAMAARHGLRASELCSMLWSQVEWKTARLTVLRNKGSVDSTHPLTGGELRALRAIRREVGDDARYVFMSELGAPTTPAGFRKMLSRVGAQCGLPTVHPHMLRHSCGFAMAEAGEDVRAMQDWLGHAAIQNTVRYTALAPGRLDKVKAPDLI